jgi:peptide/nickel transport system substrate-binding protein
VRTLGVRGKVRSRFSTYQCNKAEIVMLRFLSTIVLCILPLAAAGAAPQPGIAMHGQLRHGPDFNDLDYVNRDAPKGGTIVSGEEGTFDSVNPFIVMGKPPAGVVEYVYEGLLTRSLDEPFSLYGLLAESIDVPDDRSSATFMLRPEAHFSDGMPVTPEDVIFSWKLHRDHGRPNVGTYYKKVVSAVKVGGRGVKFTFESGGDREMPLIIGLMPVLPAHKFNPDTFEKTTVEPMTGSGPYIMARADPGRSVEYRRDPDYWGRDLPIRRGVYNFDTIRFDYYRDTNAMFEAFQKGLLSIFMETQAKRWAAGYNFRAAQEGRVVTEKFRTGLPAGMTGFVFNTRRAAFADIRVREALGEMFDASWINANLFRGLYTRTDSYFSRSELSSAGRPADARERQLLAAFPGAVRPDILEGTYLPPMGSPDGFNRAGIHRALELFGEAGYALRGGRLVNTATGEPFTFEMLAVNQDQQKLFLTYATALRRAGIDATLRLVDDAQYKRRLQRLDFDMVQYTWPASLSPGNEQLFRWSRQTADKEGTYNLAGVRSEAAEAMIGAMLKAESRDEFVSAVHALDRVLMSGMYVIPLFYPSEQWVAYWTDLHHPAKPSLYGFKIDAWWVEPPGNPQ